MATTAATIKMPIALPELPLIRHEAYERFHNGESEFAGIYVLRSAPTTSVRTSAYP